MYPAWLLSLFLASFVVGTDDMVIAGLLPSLARDLGTTEAAAGQLVTVFSLTYALGAPLMAVATGRFPRRTVLVAALAVFVLVNVAAAAAPTFWILMALRVVAALAAATITPVSMSVVADLATADSRGRYLAVITAGLTVSLVLGVPLGTWVGGTLGWRATFLLVAALSVLALLGVARTLPALAAAASPGLRERVAPLLDRTVATTLAALVISGAGGMMTYVYLAPVAEHATSLDAGRLAVAIAGFGAAGIAGTALGGTVADRASARTGILVVFGATTVAAAALLVLVIVAPVPYLLLLAGVAVYGVFVWSVNPPVQVRLLSLAGDQTAPVLGLNVSALYGGFTLAGAVGGGVLHLAGPTGLLAASCGLLATGTVMLASTFRKEPQPCASESSLGGRA